MTIDGNIRDEKLQCDINRDASKILASLSWKISKYEFLTGENILPPVQSRIIEQAAFTYSPLGKAIEKEIKATDDQGIKQVQVLKALKLDQNKQDKKWIEGIFSKDMRTNEIKNEIEETKKREEKTKRKDLKYETKKYIYGFQQFETISSFDGNVYTSKINKNEAEMDQSNLLENMVELSDKYRPILKEGKAKERYTYESVNALY